MLHSFLEILVYIIFGAIFGIAILKVLEHFGVGNTSTKVIKRIDDEINMKGRS